MTTDKATRYTMTIDLDVYDDVNVRDVESAIENLIHSLNENCVDDIQTSCLYRILDK